LRPFKGLEIPEAYEFHSKPDKASSAFNESNPALAVHVSPSPGAGNKVPASGLAVFINSHY
jgi:hypothetical protein